VTCRGWEEAFIRSRRAHLVCLRDWVDAAIVLPCDLALAARQVGPHRVAALEREPRRSLHLRSERTEVSSENLCALGVRGAPLRTAVEEEQAHGRKRSTDDKRSELVG